MLVEKDTRTSSKAFDAIHCSWYNHHATQGDDAPDDVQACFLEKEGCSRTNHAQIVPYISAELRDHEELYQHVIKTFKALFEWVRQELERHLPEEYEILSQVASILPGNACSPVEPFTSLVININVSTRGHRDVGDREFCLVIPIGTFTGGSMVMVETGLVVDLHQGDMVVFRSCDVTHLNLHYKGQRASLVMHTDKEMQAWLKNRNGWAHNITMCSYADST
ncbi:hypothetical protein PAXINDRAFT_83281 [Paxillus involutus ATCC 200175]|uniref:Unplaced genomic scaffold PAXINscaffold_45, whole genome shotgun sequence n=1 Tax=Paxillus involutus ATCC 200175 TaxID=664439 RepID=A0A0C9TNY3_PAXIN|nr:hypothetical protein PAXINDRAFT_83281 [Paxillus involutus ATCC 200175]